MALPAAADGRLAQVVAHPDVGAALVGLAVAIERSSDVALPAARAILAREDVRAAATHGALDGAGRQALRSAFSAVGTRAGVSGPTQGSRLADGVVELPLPSSRR